MSLSFPENVYKDFGDGAVRACASQAVPLELACQVIRKFCAEPSRELAVSLSWVIRARANEVWPRDIIDMLTRISLRHPDPEPDVVPVHSMDREQARICGDLLRSSANCARGSALYAISELIREHPDESGMFAEVIRASAGETHPAVRFAAARCVRAYGSIDKVLARECLDRLLTRDVRVLYTTAAEELLFQFYQDDRERYRGILTAAAAFSCSEVRERSVKLMTALTVKDDWMLEKLLSMPIDKAGMGAALAEAEGLLRSGDGKALGKQIALHCLDRGADGKELSPLLFDGVLDLEGDQDLIERLLHSEDDFLSNQALDYICGADGCITGYIGAVSAYSKERLTAATHFGELDKLIQCVARAFRQGKDAAAIRRECLQVWDELFLRFPLEMSTLSQELEQ